MDFTTFFEKIKVEGICNIFVFITYWLFRHFIRLLRYVYVFVTAKDGLVADSEAKQEYHGNMF